jgi:hypothetical protein
VKLARLLAACALWLLPTAAHAQDVVLEVPDCEGAVGAEVEKLAALELAPRMQVVKASERPVLTGTVRCERPHAHITVRDPARAQPLAIQIDLAAAAPQARQRLLALALAELITTSQLEGAPPPAPEATAAQPEPDDADDETAESSDDAAARAPLSVWVAPSFALAAEPSVALFGGELGVAHAFGPLLVSLDTHARFGHSARGGSEVALRVLSLGAFAGLILLDDGVQLSAGPGLRLGHAAMTASSSSAGVTAKDLDGVWLGPALMAALQVPLAAATLLRFAIEGGYVAKPIIGLDEDGADRLALRGPWLSVGLGLALRGL